MGSPRRLKVAMRHARAVGVLLPGPAGSTPLAGTAVAATQTSDSTGVLLATGDSSVARLDLAGAMAAYSRAHRVDPGSYEAAWKLARALADQATLTKSTDEQE